MERGIAYAIDEGARIVRVDYLEPAGFEAWVAVMESVLEEPAYRPGFDFLVDRRRADPVETAELHRMVAFIGARAARFAGSRWAIVVEGLADFGMARMGQALADRHPTTIRAFSEPEEAMRWLAERAPDAG